MPVLQDKRILIIEDTTENMRLFRVLLQLEGAIVFEAENALLGISLARDEQPDLILMDIHMPGIDGLEATRILRAEERTAGMPILAVTASIMPRELEKVRVAGCDGYLSKPIEPTLFAGQIAEYLRPSANTNS